MAGPSNETSEKPSTSSAAGILLRPLRTLRQISRRQWLYLPRLFTKQERIRIAAFAAVALIALGSLTGRMVEHLTLIRPAVGGVLREGTLTEPRFINPLYASSDTDRDLVILVFAKLFSYGENGEVVMDLAERIDVSPDVKSYTVQLRSGAEWHDGEPVSASDVVFTVKAIQDPQYKSPLRQNWQGVSVEKLSDREVRFSLRQPYAPFIENLAVGILPEHLWRRIPRETAILSDLNVKPVGSGPYRFQKFTRQGDGTITSLVLERNKHYHLRGPYVKEVRFSFYPSEEKLITAYRRNEIDALLLRSPAERQELERLDLELHSLQSPKLFAVFLNGNARSLLNRKAVRRALAAAIDRRTIIEQAYGGEAREVNSALPPGSFGFNAEISPTAYDPTQARELLQQDGWKDADEDGTLERVEGTGRNRTTEKLEIRIATSDATDLARAAELIAEMWRAIGVKTAVTALAIGDLENTLIRPRAYEALLFGEVFGHDPDPFAFWHTSQLKDPGLNIALYSNQSVDRLLEEARRTSDPRLREQKYLEFQKIVSDEIGAIFLYNPRHIYAIRKNIKGVTIGAIVLPEERFNGINTWYMETRRALR